MMYYPSDLSLLV